VQAASTISNVSIQEGGGITVGISAGVQASSAINDIIIPQALIFATGVQASITLSDIDVGLGFGVTGVQASSTIGSETIVEGTGVTVSATGVVTASTIGSETVVEGTGITVTATGVSVTSHIASVGFSAVIIVTGVSANGLISTVTVWQEIDTSQSPNWVEIAA